VLGRRILGAATGAAVVLLACYLGLAIWYWLGWPDWLRSGGAVLFPIAAIAFWLMPGRWRAVRRTAALALVAALLTAYLTKRPVDQDWIDLMARNVTAVVDGDIATLTNFRDAIHRTDEPSVARWTTQRLDLSKLEGAELIMQPFGEWKAMEHVMLSFGFADGRHVIVSIESRRASQAKFDPLAGFFRHDQIFPVIGTERDQIWLRLSKVPPNEIQIYPIRKSPEEVRAYFKRVLAFANEVAERPRFYSTLSESCMTTLINIAPEVFDEVKWYDVRRWVPGYSLSLFQQLGLIDNDLPPAEMVKRRKLRDGIEPPWLFPNDAAWSASLRSQLAS
jgi:hypothetical protein